MPLTTDRQTLDDLGIFSSRGGESIYQIFNRCKTKGGEVLLEEMFHYPLSDETQINRRAGIIESFYRTGMAFPFTLNHFDAIETYLGNTDERTRLVNEPRSFTKRLSNLVALDAETDQIHKGIHAVIAILRECEAFVNQPGLPAEHPYASERLAIRNILTEQDFEPILRSSGKLTEVSLVACDTLFRFKCRNELKNLLHYIFLLDVYISVATVAKEKTFCFAHALPRTKQRLKLTGVYHPQVKQAVPNKLDVEEGTNILFLTGANMAGKSTLMKSITIAFYLAHIGFPVAAAAMEFAVVDGIYTTINLPDNLGIGASHFYAEVLRVKKIALELAVGRKLFVLFDELFRGTNVKDAYEATIEVTKGFATKKNSLFVISTHIVEAGDELQKSCDNIRFIYLPTLVKENKPVYTYQIEAGITEDRHGMVIIQNEGILDILAKGSKKYENEEFYNG
jgi:DNA mismatch repair protein MutS